jgi:hypothetical protein
MENSKFPLRKWIYSIYEIQTCKNSISSPELAIRLGITQCNAWHMLQKLREMMAYDYDTKLGGTIEVDEALVDGKYTGKKRKLRKKDNKVTLIATAERGGK